MASLKYTHAVVCRIPLSFRTRGEIELEEAKRQHEAYVRLLRELGLDVIELPPDESLPECVFVEDTAVVCNGIALITRPGAPTRIKEVETIRAVLKKELDLPIVEIGDENAKLDGGDVLFTGREFFVGLSEWTNEAGARAVAAAFPEFPCTPVKVRPCVDPDDSLDLDTLQLRMAWLGVACRPRQLCGDVCACTHSGTILTLAILQVAESRHLKALVSMAGPDVICVGAGKAAQEVLKVFAERVDFAQRTLNMSELAKAGSGLTSCCLLFRRTRHIRSL
ncbi:hypothetical protein C0J52_22249 [Blattella germanica]|nr:hypothetical protein C0J52_22249 [Blattella germanica]